MRVFILGGGGFVGSAFGRLFDHLKIPHEVITRANYDSLRGQHCDVLINANGNSKKFLADRDPKGEFDASVRSVVHSLEDFKAETYVFLSSGDVYPRQDSPEITREDEALDQAAMSRYGLHKYTAETLVRAIHPRWLGFRMGGFVGPGLKKNAIFDMLNNQPIWLQPDSKLQFISTDTAARIVWQVVLNGTTGETVNLGAKGVVRVGDLFDRLAPRSTFMPDAKLVRFEISTEKLERLYGPLPLTVDEVDAFLATSAA